MQNKLLLIWQRFSEDFFNGVINFHVVFFWRHCQRRWVGQTSYVTWRIMDNNNCFRLTTDERVYYDIFLIIRRISAICFTISTSVCKFDDFFWGTVVNRNRLRIELVYCLDAQIISLWKPSKSFLQLKFRHHFMTFYFWFVTLKYFSRVLLRLVH